MQPALKSKSVVFKFTKSPQVYHAIPGWYKIQVWGAGSGIDRSGICNVTSSNGAYASGIIFLNQSTDLFVYVGERGGWWRNVVFNGINASNVSTHGGGGATDVRLVQSKNWYDFESLKSRIIVAGGAGGGERICGGDGGGLAGISYDYTFWRQPSAKGGTQTQGGLHGQWGNCLGTDGGFGYGGNGHGCGDCAGGGGGGYYGGGGTTYAGSGGGGSSFVSGYPGCDAIAENSIEDNITHTGQPIHYSNLFFTDAVIASGREMMPTTDLKSVKIGNDGNGYAIITQIRIKAVCSCPNLIYMNLFYIIPFIFLLLE